MTLRALHNIPRGNKIKILGMLLFDTWVIQRIYLTRTEHVHAQSKGKQCGKVPAVPNTAVQYCY